MEEILPVVTMSLKVHIPIVERYIAICVAGYFTILVAIAMDSNQYHLL